jgi:hypothetical protein
MTLDSLVSRLRFQSFEKCAESGTIMLVMGSLSFLRYGEITLSLLNVLALLDSDRTRHCYILQEAWTTLASLG